MKRRNGFYIGAVVGFLGYLIQQTSSNNPDQLGLVELFTEGFLFAIFSGCLFLFGLYALAGRGHASDTTSQKYDAEIREELNKEVATEKLTKYQQ